jgi:hypothetical protein
MTSRRKVWLIAVATSAAFATAIVFLIYLNAVPAPMRVAEPLSSVPGVDTEEFRHLQSVFLGSTATPGNRIDICIFRPIVNTQSGST